MAAFFLIGLGIRREESKDEKYKWLPKHTDMQIQAIMT